MYKRHPRLLRFWQKYDGWSLEIDIPRFEITWWSGDDIHLRRRKGGIMKEVRLPHWVWRPYCWLYGHSPYGYKPDNYCITCEKTDIDVPRKGR